MPTATIRFGGYQPAASVHTRAARVLGAAIRRRLGDEVVFDLFANVTEQGHEAADLLAMVERGDLDLCYFASSYLVRRVPALGVFDLPFRMVERTRVDYGRQHPGELKFGHSGNWGAFMVPGAALLQEAGVEATLVPYKGGGPVMQGLLAGDIDFTMAFPSVFSGQERQLKALAVVGDEKLDILPDVPTTAELGFKGLDTIGVMHRVVLAPAGIPEDRLEVLRKAFAQLPENQTYRKLMAKLGENTEQMGGAAYQKLRAEQAQRYQKLVEILTE